MSDRSRREQDETRGVTDRVGPTVVPEQVQRAAAYCTCRGCRYFESRVTLRVCHGHDRRQEGEDVCRHPDAMHYFRREESSGQQSLPLEGVPRKIRAWRSLLTRRVTPDWCPVLPGRARE